MNTTTTDTVQHPTEEHPVIFTTNNHRRELLTLADIPADVRSDWFDYVTEEDAYSPRFIHYRGSWYDTHEFSSIADGISPAGQPNHFSAWDGVQSDSHFSGVVLRWVTNDDDYDDYDAVIIGAYYC